MSFWNMITGNDLTKRWNALDARAGKLPQDHQSAYAQIAAELWQRNGFSGTNSLSLLEGVMELLEDANANNLTAQDILGSDITSFCAELAQDAGEKSYRTRWRDQLNKSVLRKLVRSEKSGKLSEIRAQKKIWRAHVRRVKALPRDYRVVYGQMQKYIFKIGPVGFEAGLEVLSGIVGLLEEGAAAGKSVLLVTGKDVAAFCDALLENVPTELFAAQELAIRETAKAMKKAAERMKSNQK